MSEELSKVLDHIEKIGELGDLGRRRADLARDRGRERAARRRAAAVAARRGRAARARPRRTWAASASPAPAPRRHERRALAHRGRRRPRASARASSTPPSCGTATASAPRPTTCNAFTWVAADGEPPAVDRERRSPACRVAVKDLFCTEGVPSQAGSKILEGYRPPYTATSVERLTGAGAPLLAKTNQDEFAMGSSTENSAYGPTLNPWDRTRVPGGSSRRLGGGRRRGQRAVGDRHRHRRLDPPARGAVRDRRAQADLRRGQPLRDDRVRVVARPGRPVHARRDRRGAAASARWPGSDPCDSTSVGLPAPVELPSRDRPARRPPRRARGADRGGDRARRAGLVPGDARPRARARRDGRAVPAPARAARAQRLLPDRARRGVVQPRPLRRRPLRLPRATACATCCACTPRRASRASAPRSSAASCSAPTRSRRATTTPTTAARRRSAR